ncbi:MAG: hypothetical protein VYC39_20130 [Myxococcota bacterium]|nr:hypothetical protein [Myxococcota bacterium]
MKNQIIVLFSLIVFALIGACQDNQQIKQESGKKARVVEKPSATQPDPSVSKPPEQPPAVEKVSGLRQTDGRQFNDHWLVILGALDKDGNPPKDWAATENKLAKLGGQATATWSNYFKGLMPCWNIIVGKSFAKKADAQAFTKKLKKAGINNYYKHAGKFVGKDPRVERACKGTEQASVRKIPFFPLVQFDGYALAPVTAPQPILARAMEKATNERPVDEARHAWIRDLIPLKIGDFSIGKRVRVFQSDGQETKSCKVKKFVSLTWGTPHFSWRAERGELGESGCGTPQVMAKLDCGFGNEGEFAVGAMGDDNLQVTPIQDSFVIAMKGEKMSPRHESLLRSTALTKAKRRAQNHAREQEAEVKTFFNSLTIGASQQTVQHVSFLTGHGDTTCGGDDFYQRLTSVLDENGQPKFEFFETEYEAIDSYIQFDNKDYFLIQGQFGAMSVRASNGKNLVSISKAFCDCEC